jgi:sec-independent protein translocase protein TatA
LVLLFFNISGGEIFVVILVAIMFFGKKGIPKVAQTLGKGMRQFKDATQEIQNDILSASREIQDEVKKQQDDMKDQFKP